MPGDGACRLKTYLQDMMQHMPPTHRGLLTLLQINSKGRTGTVRSMCTTTRDTGLKDAYNETVHQLEKFRWGSAPRVSISAL